LKYKIKLVLLIRNFKTIKHFDYFRFSDLFEKQDFYDGISFIINQFDKRFFYIQEINNTALLKNVCEQ